MSYICSSIKISGVISISEVAKNKVISLMKDDGFNHNTDFVRVGVKSGGCSGLSYTLEFVDQIEKSDEKIKVDDLNIFIDPKATLFLIGTRMDYIEDDLQSGFQFTNPNEKGRCGCGESFHV